MTKTIAAIFIALTIAIMAGCAGLNAQVDTVKQTARGAAANAADQALDSAEFALCDAATLAAVRRRYGGDPRAMQAWWAFCQTRIATAERQQPAPPLPPPENKPGA